MDEHGAPASSADSPRAAPDLLRHVVATIAYRGGKVLRDAPPGFGSTSAGPGSRSAEEILAHVGDLFDWALHLADGSHVWAEAPDRTWSRGAERFFEGLARLDRRLADERALGFDAEKLFQGPLADALSHIGQLALLRRLAGAPVRGENYFKASIRSGVVGADQPSPRREFD